MREVRERTRDVLKKYPNLTALGFDVHCEHSLLALAPQVAFVVDWLQDVEKTKRINPRCRSYGLKHVAEKGFSDGYITNGAFIVGALIAGFRAKPEGPNACFNMSRRSLKRKGRL